MAAPSTAAASATSHDCTAGLNGLRAAAQPPISPNSANPPMAMLRRPRAATRPSKPQIASDRTTMPTVSTVFWLAPRLAMLNATTSPGV